MKRIFNSHSILQLLRGKEVTMATSYSFRCSDWTLGKMSLPEHNGTGLPRESAWYLKVYISTHHSVLYSLKSNCFWTDLLEKQKAFVAATSIPRLLLYIQYIQYCTFHVKCPFIDLTFLQPVPNTSTSSATNAWQRGVWNRRWPTQKCTEQFNWHKTTTMFRPRGIGIPKYKKNPKHSKWQWTLCSIPSWEGYRQTRDCAGIMQMIKHQGTDTRLEAMSLFSLQKTVPGGGQREPCSTCRKLLRKWSLVPKVLHGGTMRGSGQKLKREVWTVGCKEKSAHHEDSEALEKTVQKGCAVSILGSPQNLTG